MQRITRLAILSLGASLFAGPAVAQIEAGDRAVGLQGTVMVASGTTAGVGYFSFNKFQTRNFGWRVSAVVVASSSGAVFGPGAGVEWNLNAPGKTTIPFVAVDGGVYIPTEGGQVSALVSPSAGVRSFVSRSTSFDVTASYSVAVSGGSSYSMLLARLGFSYYLGKDPRR